MEDRLQDMNGVLCTVEDTAEGVDLFHEFQLYHGYEVALDRDRCSEEVTFFTLTLTDEEATTLAHKLLNAVDRRKQKLNDYLKERGS